MAEAPWFRCRVQHWPIVAECLTDVGKPWPAEAVAIDLAWWQDQLRVGKVPRIPGRWRLRKRWHWPDHRVRSALRELGLAQERCAKSEPSVRQVGAKSEPGAPSLNADNEAQSAKSEPSVRQVGAKSMPHARVSTEQQNDRAQSTEDTQPAKPAAPPSERPAVPSWATKAAKGRPCTATEVLAGCVAIVEATKPQRRHRDGCSPTAAKPILALWRALERPPWAEFAEQARLVVDAAQRCPDPLFARDIRAEGWAGGSDRRRSLETVLRQAKWDARLEAAERWRDGGEQPVAQAAAGGAVAETPFQKFLRESRERREARARLEVIEGGE